LDERVGALLVQPPGPRGHRKRRDQQPARGLGYRPATGGPQLEDGQALDGRVVRTPMGRQALHARILDADLLLQKGHFSLEAVAL
jgi:hypothetical protein